MWYIGEVRIMVGVRRRGWGDVGGVGGGGGMVMILLLRVGGECFWGFCERVGGGMMEGGGKIV